MRQKLHIEMENTSEFLGLMQEDNGSKYRITNILPNNKKYNYTQYVYYNTPI